jgi:hypothetical protein
MPREVVHWVVALKALELVSSGINVDKKAYLLGAMAPDAGYFYLNGKGDNHFPEMLHGKNGEDTWLPVRIAMERCSTDYQRSFILGFISHVITDSVFHPAVYFLTGNYYDSDPQRRFRAVRNHRLIETRMDAWARKNVASKDVPVLVRDVMGTPQELKELCALFSNKDFSTEQLALSFEDFAEAQHKFLSTSVGMVVRGLSFFSSGLKELDALFSFARWGHLEAFEETFSYKNPVTGDEHRGVTWRSLLDRASEEHCRVYKKFVQAISERTDFLPDEAGPSLNFGIPSTPIQSGRFFS